MRSGGQVCEYELDVVGEDLVRPVKLEEIVPEEPYYMRGIYKTNEFYPTTFHPSVSWGTIQELFKTGRIYIKDGNKGTISTAEGS